MDTKEIERKATLPEKVVSVCISYILFLALYGFSGWYASSLSEVGSFVFDFECHIPFLPWMIIPYMSSGAFFIGVFFLCSSHKQLLLFTLRTNLLTILSCLLFVLFPLRFSFAKPAVDSPFLAFFFQFLNTWDTPYNQAPSLHIGYACLFWTVIRQELKGGWKVAAGVWLLLMAVSTLTVYQHHLIDIITALLLVGIILSQFKTTTISVR